MRRVKADPSLLRPAARSFYDPIYQINYCVVISDREDYLPTLKKSLTGWVTRSAAKEILTKSDHDMTDCNGRCIRLPSLRLDEAIADVIVIWLRAGADVAVLAHEAWHALMWVFDRRGMDASLATEEAVAHYLQWIVRSALGVRT